MLPRLGKYEDNHGRDVRGKGSSEAERKRLCAFRQAQDSRRLSAALLLACSGAPPAKLISTPDLFF